MATNKLSIDDAIQIVSYNLTVQNEQVICNHLRCISCPLGYVRYNYAPCEVIVTEAIELTKPLLLTNPELFV